jgi:hypothetical protein
MALLDSLGFCVLVAYKDGEWFFRLKHLDD